MICADSAAKFVGLRQVTCHSMLSGYIRPLSDTTEMSMELITQTLFITTVVYAGTKYSSTIGPLRTMSEAVTNYALKNTRKSKF